MPVAMETVSIPVNLDAFVLCEDSCNGDSRIAPITQPNYLGLRLDSFLIRNDILEHVDFHRSKPASGNPRLTDIGKSLGDSSPVFRSNRLGVHLHWSLPKFYRSGTSSDAAASSTSGPEGTNRDQSQPVFKNVPNRWLLVRRLTSDHPPQIPKVCQLIEFLLLAIIIWWSEK
jgi:hypothetical protein